MQSLVLSSQPRGLRTLIRAKVLAKRPDLVLHVWSTRDGHRLSDEDLAVLTSLRHVRKLEVTSFKNKSLYELGAMTRLESLTIGGKLGDLGFVSRLGASGR